MAYASISFTALEQPTLAKWNILGTNDAYFNTQIGANFSSGTTSTVWWEEIGRTTLGVAGDTISITGLPARNFLKLQFHIFSTGGTIAGTLRFNNDSGTNYAVLYATNMSGTTTAAQSQTAATVGSSLSQGTQFGTYDISNFTAQRKLIVGKTLDDNNASATTTCNSIEITGKWDNSSAQISRVDLLNVGTGDFAIGSKLIVLGHD